jgi:hypothetical protein
LGQWQTEMEDKKGARGMFVDFLGKLGEEKLGTVK